MPYYPLKSDRCWEKMKPQNNRKVREASGMRCVLSPKKKGRTRESNMRSNQYDSALCPLAFLMSQAIFKDHRIRTHTHTQTAWDATNCKKCTVIVIVFFCLCICTDNMWSSHFIPHVKRHYSCWFPLIDSFFFHFIFSQRVQGLISGLCSHLLETSWGTEKGR